jgi:hypothetical protein
MKEKIQRSAPRDLSQGSETIMKDPVNVHNKFENDKFKQALKTLTLDNLPLSVCCRHSGDIDKDSVEITILSSAESENIIQCVVRR